MYRMHRNSNTGTGIICAVALATIYVLGAETVNVHGIASDEFRPCNIQGCTASGQFNLTCGFSGETLTFVRLHFGQRTGGSCVPGNAKLDTDDPFEFDSSCNATEAQLEEYQKKIDSACTDKVECSNIDGEKFEDYIASIEEELQKDVCNTGEVVLAGKCGPPGFDVIANLPLFMTAFIGLGLGCSLTLDNFKRVWIAHKAPFFIGLCSQFLFMPLLAYIFAVGFNFPDTTGIGMIIAGSCPGGATSNLYTYWSHGDVALSITMSGASTLAAVAMMPFLLWLYISNTYGSNNSVPFQDIFATLMVAVIPAFIGVAIQYKYQKVAYYLEISASAIGMIFLIAVLIVGGLDNPDLIEMDQFPLTWTCLFFYQPLGTLFGYGVATLLGKVKEGKWYIDRADKRAIAMECGVQSYAIAIAVVAVTWSGCQRNSVLMPIYIASICYIINSAWIVPLFRWYARYDPVEELEARKLEAEKFGLEVRDRLKKSDVAPDGNGQPKLEGGDDA